MTKPTDVRASWKAWNPATGQLLNTAKTVVHDLAVSPNGRLLATADMSSGTVRLWLLPKIFPGAN